MHNAFSVRQISILILFPNLLSKKNMQLFKNRMFTDKIEERCWYTQFFLTEHYTKIREYAI